MKKLFFAVALLLGAASVAHANDYPNAISVQDAKAWMDQGTAVMVDVREQNEVALGMAAPAEWYPFSSIRADLDAFVKFLGQAPGKEVVVYCRSGHRASIVVESLSTRGIKAWNMGGFQDWVDAGFPTRKN